MNDRRFIELLNLYLDHQIAADEAAELEAEVMRSPARRRTYDQYCRLQRGCGLLGERERSTAPASAAFARSLREAERKIAAPRSTSWWSPAYTGVFAASAMAACVAVIVVVRDRAPSSTGVSGETIAQTTLVAPVQKTVATESALAVASITNPPTDVRAVPASFELQPILGASGFGVVRNAREAEIASTDRQALEWMQRVEQSGLQSIVVDDQTFEARATLHQEDNRVFRSRHGITGNAEFTAFQFQR